MDIHPLLVLFKPVPTNRQIMDQLGVMTPAQRKYLRAAVREYRRIGDENERKLADAVAVEQLRTGIKI